MADFENNRQYNSIFSQIVENNDDFVGSMAYVLYKMNKIDYIEQFKKDHNNEEPSIDELREWQKGECTKTKLANYKKLAQVKITEFVNNLQSDKEKQLTKQKTELDKKDRELKGRDRQLKENEKDLQKRSRYCQVKSKGQFWMGVLQSLLASVIFIVLSFIVIINLTGKPTELIVWLQGMLEH